MNLVRMESKRVQVEVEEQKETRVTVEELCIGQRPRSTEDARSRRCSGSTMNACNGFSTTCMRCWRWNQSLGADFDTGNTARCCWQSRGVFHSQHPLRPMVHLRRGRSHCPQCPLGQFE
ncbi:hypothetical protein T4B_12413 [Trichinella pseudospiralis]|uniref:Uncharacterized protein n=1 Tax=Trichinella pseudospiralis TaxID=6337 RepID=A0A0V1ICZ7_TRIPS|nr:hypothetical protein T4A_8851 [Trichinella pseudospiralis]KRZ20324.1 hypothetical protein T4B_12413 [Trichinella pseudospiralis]KRZ42967.1 hypothetical protein T4C_11293 [Trichinella pseudospiralis]